MASGKTTVALGLAAAASHRGARVLVVDLDPQANATSGLGVWEPASTVDAALESDRPGVGAARSRWSRGGPCPTAPRPGRHRPRWSPARPPLAAREPQLANDPIGAQDRLQLALEGNDFDLVRDRLPAVARPAHRQRPVRRRPGPGGHRARRLGLRRRRPDPAHDHPHRARRDGRPAIAGIAVNRLGRTRDAKYWHGQLVDDYGDLVLSPVHLRAAVAEASAQSLPIHGLGARAGAPEAAAEFDALLDAVVPELARPAPAPAAPASAPGPAPPVRPPPAPVPPRSRRRSSPARAPVAEPAVLADPTGDPDAVVRPATIPTPPVAR